jgi:hypothetical protein
MPVDGFDYTITWAKFTKVSTAPNSSDADGYTHVVYQSNNIQPVRGKGKTVVVKSADITITLDSGQSWVVETKTTNDLLTHEQGHYDITALGARELYTGLLKLKAADVKALEDKVNELSEALQRKIDTTNHRYDEQTDHSKIKALQEKWNKSIAMEKQKSNGSLDNLPH